MVTPEARMPSRGGVRFDRLLGLLVVTQMIIVVGARFEMWRWVWAGLLVSLPLAVGGWLLTVDPVEEGPWPEQRARRVR